MGQGALAAVEAAGRQDDVWIASQNASASALANLYLDENNAWFGSTAYFPERYGEFVFEIVDLVIAGEELPEETLIDHLFIGKEHLHFGNFGAEGEQPAACELSNSVG